MRWIGRSPLIHYRSVVEKGCDKAPVLKGLVRPETGGIIMTLAHKLATEPGSDLSRA